MWLVVAMSVGVCAPSLLSAWHTGPPLIEAEVDPIDCSMEKKGEADKVVYEIARAPDRSSTLAKRPVADEASLSGCTPDAPPTPPPDWNA